MMIPERKASEREGGLTLNRKILMSLIALSVSLGVSGCYSNTVPDTDPVTAEPADTTQVSGAASETLEHAGNEQAAETEENTETVTEETPETDTQLKETAVDYSLKDNWAYYAEGTDKPADLFLICPTVDMNDEYNMSMDDTETKENFYGALNMERGIYEEYTRMFAPYYRQGAMKIYGLSPEEREPYLEFAYRDVADAFEYYLENENDGRAIVLAGFSQGADLCYRLLKDYFGDDELYRQLVAVYAIGWPCTEEMAEAYPQIVPAASEFDTGVVVSFDCEAPELAETFITPSGTHACTINPLNWCTDATPADAALNLGACFTDYSGGIAMEVEGLCGCYIDEERGILKVTDIQPSDYPAYIPGLEDGAYHIYDYQFFYRNLQQNVGGRIQAFLN